jgi:hypothetical protein
VRKSKIYGVCSKGRSPAAMFNITAPVTQSVKLKGGLRKVNAKRNAKKKEAIDI